MTTIIDSKKPITSYEEALSFVESLDISATKLGLSRIRRILERLENPQNELSIIHIGGTNGKGSVSAMLTQVLTAEGYRVGTFVSPHLYDIRERIQLDGRWISKTDFMNEVVSLYEVLWQYELPQDEWPTYFEFLNILAFRYFYRQQVDMAVLEVGLGGRLDSTNVVEKPVLSIITGIAKDHQEHLGSSITAIAGEKAGIIKADVPLVLGAGVPEEALKVMQEKSKRLNVSWVQASQERCKRLENKVSDELSSGQRVWDSVGKMELILPLLGSYQVENLTTVLTALGRLEDQGVRVSKESIKGGLAKVRWPARFHYFETQKLLIDGGHNAQGFQALQTGIQRYFGESPLFWLVSLRNNRPLDTLVNMVSSFENSVKIYCIAGPNPSLYFPSIVLAERFEHVFPNKTRCFKDIRSALCAFESERLMIGGVDCVGLICGSLYTAGDAIQLLTATNGTGQKES